MKPQNPWKFEATISTKKIPVAHSINQNSEARFQIIRSMLDQDPNLRSRIEKYLEK